MGFFSFRGYFLIVRRGGLIICNPPAVGPIARHLRWGQSLATCGGAIRSLFARRGLVDSHSSHDETVRWMGHRALSSGERGTSVGGWVGFIDPRSENPDLGHPIVLGGSDLGHPPA